MRCTAERASLVSAADSSSLAIESSAKPEDPGRDRHGPVIGEIEREMLKPVAFVAELSN